MKLYIVKENDRVAGVYITKQAILADLHDLYPYAKRITANHYQDGNSVKITFHRVNWTEKGGYTYL